MGKSILRVVHKEIVGPQKFLERLGEQRLNISRVKIQPPRLGQRGYGKFVISYRHPILKPQHG
jgi:hypothetical protein